MEFQYVGYLIRYQLFKRRVGYCYFHLAFKTEENEETDLIHNAFTYEIINNFTKKMVMESINKDNFLGRIIFLRFIKGINQNKLTEYFKCSKEQLKEWEFSGFKLFEEVFEVNKNQLVADLNVDNKQAFEKNLTVDYEQMFNDLSELIKAIKNKKKRSGR